MNYFKKLPLIAFAVTAVSLLALSGCAPKSGSASGDVDSAYTTSGGGASETGGIGLGTLKRVHFDFDQSGVNSEAAGILKDNAAVIKGNSKMRVLVEGHCDDRGTNEYNVALGERRAKAVMDYLVSLGVDRSRLEMKSWGEEKPLDTSKGEAAYSLNRRAEFLILAK